MSYGYQSGGPGDQGGYGAPPPGGGGYGYGGGPGGPGGPPGPPPNNFLIPSILATVFCCLLGIVGIVFASQVNSKWAQGDYAGAQEAADKAKTWTFIAMGIGLVGIVLYVIFVVVIGIGASTSGNFNP